MRVASATQVLLGMTARKHLSVTARMIAVAMASVAQLTPSACAMRAMMVRTAPRAIVLMTAQAMGLA